MVDLRLADGSGLDLVPELKAMGSRVRRLHLRRRRVLGAVRLRRRRGRLRPQERRPRRDAQALRTVLDDRVHVDDAVAGLLVEGVQAGPRGGAKLVTPARDRRCCKLAADGLSNSQIAERLGVTALAVKGHFVRIGRKLGANDRTQMVVLAMRADLLR